MSKYYPNARAFVGNGAAREGVSSTDIVMREAGHKTNNVGTAMWPYPDLEAINHGLAPDKRLNFQYFDKDIFYIDRIDENGVIRTNYRKEMIKNRMIELGELGEKGVFQLHSGSQNPSAFVIPMQDKLEYVQLARQFGHVILSDDTYLQETYREVDKHTFGQAADQLAQETGDEAYNDTVISVVTFTKDMAAAGGRVYAAFSKRKNFFEDMQRCRDLDHMNTAAIAALSALVSNPVEARRIIDDTRDLAEQRVLNELLPMAQASGRAYNVPVGGLYLLTQSRAQAARGDMTPMEVARKLADRGAGALPVADAMGGRDPSWHDIVRFAAAGGAPAGGRTFADVAALYFERDDELANEFINPSQPHTLIQNLSDLNPE